VVIDAAINNMKIKTKPCLDGTAERFKFRSIRFTVGNIRGARLVEATYAINTITSFQRKLESSE
jgi:hypothetical protein